MSDFLFPGNCPLCEGPPFQDPNTHACEACLDEVLLGQLGRMQALQGADAGFRFRRAYLGAELSGGRSVLPLRPLSFVLDRTGKKLIHEIKYHGVCGAFFKTCLIGSTGRRVFASFSKDRFWFPCLCIESAYALERIQPKPLDRPSPEQGNGRSDGDAELLARNKHMPSQTRLDRSSRKANVKCLALKPGTSFNKETVVLIDDVFTTGATLTDSCAQFS